MVKHQMLNAQDNSTQINSKVNITFEETKTSMLKH